MRVKDIISRVTLMYHDETYSRITQTQYLQLLDDAIMQLVLTRPDSHEKRTVIQLEPGARQELPTEAFVLTDIYNNKTKLSADSYADGRPVFQVARKNLDYFSNWYGADTAIVGINEFAYDNRTPRYFWVNPPVGDTPVYVEIAYSYQVPQYADLTDSFDAVMDMELPISNVFRMALINYLLYLLYSTDSTSQADRAIAQDYLKSFYTGLQLEYQTEVTAIPRIIEQTTKGIGVHTLMAPSQEGGAKGNES